MLGFSEERFMSVLKGAVANIEKIDQIADAISKKGFKNLYLVGSGGGVCYDCTASLSVKYSFDT